jgi:hypothetical protein
VQHLLLAVDLERRDDRVRRDEIGERHEWDLGSRAVAGADFYSSMTRGKNLRSLPAIVLKGGGP